MELLAVLGDIEELVENAKMTGLTNSETTGVACDGCAHAANLTRKAQQNRTAILTGVVMGSKFLEYVTESGDDQVTLIAVV